MYIYEDNKAPNIDNISTLPRHVLRRILLRGRPNTSVCAGSGWGRRYTYMMLVDTLLFPGRSYRVNRLYSLFKVECIMY